MLNEAVVNIYRVNLGVKKGERVLVFTDDFSSRLKDIARLTAELGRPFTSKISYVELKSTGSHGVEPPETLWAKAFGGKTITALKQRQLLKPILSKKADDGQLKEAERIIKRYKKEAVDVIIALSHYSTSHTKFRDFITRLCGTRYASMPLFDATMFEGSMRVDWKALSQRTKKIAAKVNKGVLIKIRTPNGTHLILSKKGRKAFSDTGILTKPGSFGNLPAGEVFLAPLEGTANGTLVLEWAPTRPLETPITLKVKDGMVVEIDGEEEYADFLRAKLSERPENASIAELGIGTNEKATRPNNILESEKIRGTVHIALGDNSSFGGMVRTPFHQDFVFFKPTLTLTHKDGVSEKLIEKGRLV
ncbi:MAG: aminopeptidase [Nitrospirae bacterium]|nr:aminopeptidase [Nitrospirota bacterium]